MASVMYWLNQLPELMDRLRPGWRGRAARQRSPWNLVCVLVGLVIAAAAWAGLVLGAWKAHTGFFPEHAGQFGAFWGKGISGRAFLSSFLLIFPLGVPALTAGFLAANVLLWCVRPARRAMEAEAAGDPEMTFAGGMVRMAKWGGIASGIALALSFLGAVTLKSLR